MVGKAETGIAERILAADRLYGCFASAHEAIGVACEEWDELRAALHANDIEAMKHEALDLAAVLVRLHDQLCRDGEMRRRSTGANRLTVNPGRIHNSPDTVPPPAQPRALLG